MKNFFKKVFNFLNSNSARPLITKEGEIFLRNLDEKDFDEKIKEIKKGNPTYFDIEGKKPLKLNLVRNLDPIS